jgi:hypothetical protein
VNTAIIVYNKYYASEKGPDMSKLTIPPTLLQLRESVPTVLPSYQGEIEAFRSSRILLMYLLEPSGIRTTSKRGATSGENYR